jgi:hypothetical protein
MNCKQTRTTIHAHGYQSDRLDSASREHLDACELCHTWYQDNLLRLALASRPVPEPDPDFIDRVLKRATAARPRTPRRHAWAAAAGLFVVLGTLLTVTSGWREPGLEEALTQQTAEPRIVQIVINSTGRRQDATVTIRLAEDLELDGYPGRQLLEWQTDLEDGRNLLALPVRATKAGGALWVAVSYDGLTRQETRIDIDAG